MAAKRDGNSKTNSSVEGSHVDPDFEERERQRKIDALMQEREVAFGEEEKTVFVWKSPARPFKQRSKEFYTTVGAIVILLSLILLFAREFLLVAVILSMAFVAYVFATVEPEEVEHEISTRGIRTGGKFFRWDVLGRFWFSEKYGRKLLSVETGLRFPGELLMVLNKGDEEKVKDLLTKYLLHETPEPEFVDKAAKWLQEKVPLEE